MFLSAFGALKNIGAFFATETAFAAHFHVMGFVFGHDTILLKFSWLTANLLFTSNCNPLIKKKQEGKGKKYSRRGTPDKLVLSKGRGEGRTSVPGSIWITATLSNLAR
jgi:hypothetical protein